MKYAVINQYGIVLRHEEDHPRRDGYVYVPRATGERSAELCERWIRRYDPAGTCSIVEYVREMKRERGQ